MSTRYIYPVFLLILLTLFFFNPSETFAKTCWVSGQDSCRSNCQQQFNYACDDGSTYSDVRNCCSTSGGGSTQTVPSVPTGVDYNCSYTGNQVTIQWGAVSGASKYAIRVQREGQALPSCNGQQAANLGGVCNDNVTGTSYTMSVDADARYGYWLHSVNSAGWSTAVSGPTQIRCAPNCSNVQGPLGLLVNETGRYSAGVESLDGDLTGQLFVNNFSAMGSYNRLPGYSGTTTYDWRPTAAGSYQMNCRAWNDSRVECRAAGVPRVNGSGVVNPPEQRQCVGPNTTKTVQVFNPADVTLVSQSSGNMNFRATWRDSRGSRSINLARCTDTNCRTLDTSISCPSGIAIGGSTKSTSGGWCRYELSDSSTTKNWSVHSYTSGLSPGKYVFAINQVVSGVGCSGNPICTTNGGSVNCGSTWISCGTQDYVSFTTTNPPTNTPTPTATPMPQIDVADKSIAGNLITNNQRTDGRCDYGQWCKWSRNQTSTSTIQSNGDLRIATQSTNQEYGSCWIQWVQNGRADGSFYRLRAGLSSNFPSGKSFFQFETSSTQNMLNPPVDTSGKSSIDWAGYLNNNNLPLSLKFCTWGTGTVNAQAILQSVSLIKTVPTSTPTPTRTPTPRPTAQITMNTSGTMPSGWGWQTAVKNPNDDAAPTASKSWTDRGTTKTITVDAGLASEYWVRLKPVSGYNWQVTYGTTTVTNSPVYFAVRGGTSVSLTARYAGIPPTPTNTKPPTPTPTTSYVCKTDADCAYCGANCITKGTQLTCSRIAVVGLSCICVTGRCTSVKHTATPKPPTPTNTKPPTPTKTPTPRPTAQITINTSGTMPSGWGWQTAVKNPNDDAAPTASKSWTDRGTTKTITVDAGLASEYWVRLKPVSGYNWQVTYGTTTVTNSPVYFAVRGGTSVSLTARYAGIPPTPTRTATPRPPTPTITVAPATPTLTPTVQPPTATEIPPTNTSAPQPTVDECPNFVLGNATCDAEGAVNAEDYTCWRNQYITKLGGGTPSAIANCKRVANFDNSDDGVTLLDFAIWRINALRQSTQ